MARTLYAVCFNGAVWSNYDRVEDAIKRAQELVKILETHGSYQGFDESGQSAVVSRPNTLVVEELVNSDSNTAGWTKVGEHFRALGGIVQY